MTDLYAFETFPEQKCAEIRFFSMNTLVRLRAWVSKGLQANDAYALERTLNDARLACLRYERMLSRTIPESDVSQINVSRGNAVRVNPETAEVLKEAVKYCEKSNGAFDITIGAITELWDFHIGHIPEPELVAEAKKHVGFRGISVYEEGGAQYVRLSDPNAKIDLGGIAKGWAVDMLVRQLMGNGLMGVLVDIGGNVAVSGSKPDGQPWKIGLKEPHSPFGNEGVLDIVELESGSIATSGVYERSFEEGGKLFHHILDPQTGYPLETCWKAVSVVADSALEAEGFSTTLLSMDVDSARALLNDAPGVRQAFFIDENHQVTALYAANT